MKISWLPLFIEGVENTRPITSGILIEYSEKVKTADANILKSIHQYQSQNSAEQHFASTKVAAENQICADLISFWIDVSL